MTPPFFQAMTEQGEWNLISVFAAKNATGEDEYEWNVTVPSQGRFNVKYSEPARILQGHHPRSAP